MKKLKILNMRVANATEWDTIWSNCEYSTYFHSREWSLIWQKYSNGKVLPSPIIIEFSDSTKVLLPFSKNKRFKGFLNEYHSSPAGTFGGWLSNDSLAMSHGQLLYKFIVKNFPNIIWRINPYNPIEKNLKLRNFKEDYTRALNLSEGFEKIFKKWSKGHKSAAKKAQREGVTIKLAETIEEWKTYFNAYEDSLRRWGSRATSRYRWKLFEEIFQLNSPNVKLWIASYKNEIIAGALCFYAKNHVVYWHGAAKEQYFNVRPVTYLFYEIIKDAVRKSYVWFDFNPSGGHKGVEEFKRRFGAETLYSPVVVQTSTAARALVKFRKLLRNYGI